MIYNDIEKNYTIFPGVKKCHLAAVQINRGLLYIYIFRINIDFLDLFANPSPTLLIQQSEQSSIFLLKFAAAEYPYSSDQRPRTHSVRRLNNY
jgi:hypothetical protein